MSNRIVHKPKKGAILELPLGHQAEFGPFDKPITYCGMLNPDVYSLGIPGNVYMGFNLYLPVPAQGEEQTLDDVLERTANVKVVKVTPRAITLKYVK